MYPPGEYDLAGFTVGAVEKARLLDGSAIGAGDLVVGVDSSGPHSNGYSLVRRILERAGVTPDNGGLELQLDGTTLADALMAPTTLYVKPVLSLLQSVPVHGMAHITGGGLLENIIRVVPQGLGIELDSSRWNLPAVFGWLQREGHLAREEMWRTFNCGIGFTVIVAPEHADAAIRALDEHDLGARVIGHVAEAPADTRVRMH